MKRIMIFAAAASIFALTATTFGLPHAQAIDLELQPAKAVPVSIATLKWTPPQTMADGTEPVVLSGYRVYWGGAPGVYTDSRLIADPAATGVTLQVVPGLTYFAVAAIGADGVESSPSLEVSSVIGPAPVPAPKFVVAPAGARAMRPAFAMTAGKRSYSSNSQVAVGAACDCTVQIVEGRLTFCEVAPALVAVCVPTP